MQLVKIYLKNLINYNYYQCPISLHFSVFCFISSLLDPDPHIECESGSKKETECRSGSTVLLAGEKFFF